MLTLFLTVDWKFGLIQSVLAAHLALLYLAASLAATLFNFSRVRFKSFPSVAGGIVTRTEIIRTETVPNRSRPEH